MPYNVVRWSCQGWLTNTCFYCFCTRLVFFSNEDNIISLRLTLMLISRFILQAIEWQFYTKYYNRPTCVWSCVISVKLTSSPGQIVDRRSAVCGNWWHETKLTHVCPFKLISGFALFVLRTSRNNCWLLRVDIKFFVEVD